MTRRIAQLQLANGRRIVTVVPDGDAAVVRLGHRRFEKVVDDNETLSYREIAVTPPDPTEEFV